MPEPLDAFTDLERRLKGQDKRIATLQHHIGLTASEISTMASQVGWVERSAVDSIPALRQMYVNGTIELDEYEHRITPLIGLENNR